MEKIFEYIKKEWDVLKNAPLSFIGLFVIALVAGSTISSLHFSERISAVEAKAAAKDGEISRYRVALGIDKASSGSLIELTNGELRAKALGTAETLHQFCVGFRDRDARLESEVSNSKDKASRHFGLLKQESDEFDASGARADASLVEVELRRRLSPQAKASIFGLPLAFKGADGGYLTLLAITGMGSGMDAAWICTVGNGIEEMAKLLPPDGGDKVRPPGLSQ